MSETSPRERSRLCCEELEYGDQLVATALNRDFVRAKDRVETPLRENDAVEIVAPKQGG